jgi:hypothetical protein
MSLLDDSAEDSPWLAALSPAKRRLYKAFAIFCLSPLVLVFTFATLLSPLIIIAWASVAHGERGQTRRTQCGSRLRNVGFEGNPDFYGMGIRIGIYLQWLSSLTANAFLPGERRNIAGAYAASSIALFVALLLLVFRNECAFTAEIIVMLNIIWGGTYQVMLPHMGKGREKKLSGFLGLKGVTMVFMLTLVPISAWFWLRIASVGEDFVATPSGTSFFLFAHVRGGGLEIASRFMAFLSIWISSTPVLLFIIYPIERAGLQKLAIVFVLLTAMGFFGAVIFIYSIIFGYILGTVGRILLSTEDLARFRVHLNETELRYW